MNKDPFDKEFDAAFAEAARDHEWLPDAEASWKRVEARLNRRRRKRERLRVLPYIAASFILGALIFGSPAVSGAFQPLFRTLVTFQEGVTHVMFGTEEEPPPVSSSIKPPPASDQPSGTLTPGSDVPSDNAEKKFSTWEEAASSVPFPRPFIPRVPAGFKLDQVLVYSQHASENTTTSVLLYSNSEGKVVTVTFRQLREGEMMSSDYRERDGKLEIIRIGSHEAYLFATRDGSSSLEWLEGRLYVALVGPVSKETIMEMAAGAK